MCEKHELKIEELERELAKTRAHAANSTNFVASVIRRKLLEFAKTAFANQRGAAQRRGAVVAAVDAVIGDPK